MRSEILCYPVFPVRLTAVVLSAACVWLFAPELAQAAVAFGEIGTNVADNAKGVAKGITMAGYAFGVGMGVFGCVEMYKAGHHQQDSTYAGGIKKVIIGACILGLGEFMGSGSATLFGSDQTTGLNELGIK